MKIKTTIESIPVIIFKNIKSAAMELKLGLNMKYSEDHGQAASGPYEPMAPPEITY